MASDFEPVIHDVFEDRTSTWQYIVADPDSKTAVIIDPVLDYDLATNSLASKSADSLLTMIKGYGYHIDMLLETHIHADHVSASKYLQRKLAAGGNVTSICIGKRVRETQERFSEKYGIPRMAYANTFDKLFDDDETFYIGSLKAKAIHLPGHTPDHMGYLIGSNVFCGDSLFNPDVGSARCDFPGGDAGTLHASVRKLLGFPEHFNIWTGHDYPPSGEDGGRSHPLASTTIGRQRRENKHLKDGVKEDEFLRWRSERDARLAPPRLIHQSLQLNIRAGELPHQNDAGDRLLYVPLDTQKLEW